MSHAWGLSDHGFKAKDLPTIKNELESTLQREVDSTLNFGEGTVAGQLTAVVANQARQVWEAAHDLYHSLNPDTAFGASLDALCKLTGTFRRQAKRSQVRVLVRLDSGANLPKDSIAASSNNLNARFRTVADIKNDSPKEAFLEVDMLADEVGPVFAKAGSVNHIVTPHAGWLGVTNPKDATIGCFDETDDALRVRRLSELRSSAASTREALISHLGALNGVQAVHIDEGVHNFTAYVMGGDEQEICQTLWLKKPLGVATLGSINHPVTASNGQIFSVSFSRPTLIPLSLHIELRVKSMLVNNEIVALQRKIIEYLYANIKLGDDPYPSRLYAILFDEPKILDTLSIKLGRVGSTEPVPNDIKPHELASFDIGQIFIHSVVGP